MYTSLLMVLGSCVTAQNSGGDGKLVWAADANGGIPYVFHDERASLVGFEVDLVEALSKELGRPIVFKQYDFEALFDGLNRKDFDFAMNGLELTPENLKEGALFPAPTMPTSSSLWFAKVKNAFTAWRRHGKRTCRWACWAVRQRNIPGKVESSL